MRSMQELIFLAGWVEMGHFVYLMLSFLKQTKSITLKRTKIRIVSPKEKGKKLICLKLAQVFCGQLSL